MTLCHNCERFDLQSFRCDPHGRRGLVLKDVLENADTCSFCSLLKGCLDPLPQATWVHFELLDDKRRRINQGRGPLQAAFLRVVLAERPYFPFAIKFFDQSRWAEALLHLCADEGM